MEEKMLQNNPVRIQPQAGSISTPGFHNFRLMFNRHFLNSEFDLAYGLCLQASSLKDISIDEQFELLKFLLMLGKLEDAMSLIGSVLASDETQHSFALKKADILRLSGDSSEFIAYLKTRIKSYPRYEDYYTCLYNFARQNAFTDEISELRATAERNGITIPDSIDQSQEFPPVEISESSLLLTEQTLMSFLQLFKGRENSYARQWVSETGKHGYTLVSEPPNLNSIRNHLQGIYTLGFYQLDLNSKVKWIAFDLDLEKSHLNDFHDSHFHQWVDEASRQVVTKLVNLLDFYHIKSNIEFSGYKGYHVWVLLEEKISASIARSFAQRIAAQIDLNALPLQLEVFPKQVKAGIANFGNLVKLPYGIHRVTGLSSTMLNSSFEPIPVQDFIQNPNLTSLDVFVSALSSLDPNYMMSFPAENKSSREGDSDFETSDAAAASFPDIDPEADPEWLHLKSHCHALSQIDMLISTTGILSPQQKLALKFSCGYLKSGPRIVNTLLKKCRNLEPGDLLKTSFKGNAISCAKMSNYLKDVLDPAQCNCGFDPALGSYPSPLLHLHSLESETNRSALTNDLKIKDLVEGFLKLKKQARETNELLNQIEKKLLMCFEEIGLDQINTPYGLLKKTVLDDNIQISLELK